MTKVFLHASIYTVEFPLLYNWRKPAVVQPCPLHADPFNTHPLDNDK
ncbi:hypothetical protein CRE_23406 [Caenorhabditis remanei]|uniref:Uncharacterized protein n=1 Tax=Caenorhabditis remanei TaxID=31234 RepID=E3MGM3_CAERE|nr:hypothetical protein CRE_23406 [Caenorhabditis remanei]